MSRRCNGTNRAMVQLGLNRYKLGITKKNTGKDFAYAGKYAAVEKNERTESAHD